ncbi:MAG: hypothetical protein ACREA0_11925, partial [bacterium]
RSRPMGALHDVASLPEEKKRFLAGCRWLDDEGIWVCPEKRAIFSFNYIESHSMEEIRQDLETMQDFHADWRFLFNDQHPPEFMQAILRKAGN